MAGLAIWPRLDDANTLGNTEVDFVDQTMLEREAIAAFRASPLKAELPKSSSFHNNFHINNSSLGWSWLPWLVVPALAGLAIWPRLDNAKTLGNTEVNFVDQTMLEGEAIAAFRASPQCGEFFNRYKGVQPS